MASVTLDRERMFKFRGRDFEEIERMMGGKPMQELLGDCSYTFLKRACFVGLRFDASMDQQRWTLDLVEKLIEDKIEADKSFNLPVLAEIIQKAVNESGLYGNFLKADTPTGS